MRLLLQAFTQTISPGLSCSAQPLHCAAAPLMPADIADVVTRVGVAETAAAFIEAGLAGDATPQTPPDKLLWCGSDAVALFWEVRGGAGGFEGGTGGSVGSRVGGSIG